MIVAPLPPDETDRLAALRALNVLDTAPEPEFDRIAAMAKAITGAPIALVALLDAERNWFKARIGLGDLCESPRDTSFCAHAIRDDAVLWVADTTQDERFVGNPMVTDGPRLRFYAGAPVVLGSGQRVGTVCVTDVQPRAYDQAIADHLADLARTVGDRLELRRLSYVELLSRNIIASTSEAVICVNAQGRIDFWNAAATTVFGWSEAEALGGSLDMIIPATHRAAHHEGFSRMIAGGAPRLLGRTVEVPAVNKAGQELPIEITLSTWGSGEQRGVGAIIRDLSERKRTEEELRRARETEQTASRRSAAAHETMALLVRSATTALVMTDRDLVVIDVSDRWTESYGRARETVVGRCIHDVFPSSRERWEPVYRRCLAGARERGDRAVSDHAGPGAQRWIQWESAPWRDAEGEVAGLLLTNHDVTPLVEAKEEAERDQRRLLMAVDIADLVVWSATFADRSMRLTGPAEALFDFPLTFEVLIDPTRSMVHPEDQLRVDEAWREHRDKEGPFSIEHRAQRRDGEIVWVSSTLEVQRDASGRRVGAIGVMRDVTRRKTWEEDIRRARDAAEAANRAKDEFLANMSHEIRTPLNGVLGLTGALALSPLDADQRLMLQTMEDSGRELERMLTSVLELVCADSGATEPRNAPLDVPGLLQAVREARLPAAQAKGLELRIVGAGAAGSVLGDEGRIRDVLSRLLDNAVKFTAAGSITLEAQLEAAGPRVRARFIVRDTGVGFDPADAERLFARFQQADGSSTRRFGGSGLGLAVCRSLAAAMGGTVEATSAPGQGSSFALTLELEGEVAAATAVAAEPAPRALRVLLAEDHPVNRQVVELILADAGVDLTCVENGAEAVDASATAEFDLVLMDVQMPVMDGLTAIRAIRARENAGGVRRTPIYTLTANAMAQDAAAALAAGADEHLTKPISAARLVAAVRRAAPVGAEAARAA